MYSHPTVAPHQCFYIFLASWIHLHRICCNFLPIAVLTFDVCKDDRPGQLGHCTSASFVTSCGECDANWCRPSLMLLFPDVLCCTLSHHATEWYCDSDALSMMLLKDNCWAVAAWSLDRTSAGLELYYHWIHLIVAVNLAGSGWLLDD